MDNKPLVLISQDMRLKECAITSAENWKKYVETGDASLLGDIDVTAAVVGTVAILAGEGWERTIVLGSR
jgi:hypothetical protein